MPSDERVGAASQSAPGTEDRPRPRLEEERAPGVRRHSVEVAGREGRILPLTRGGDVIELADAGGRHGRGERLLDDLRDVAAAHARQGVREDGILPLAHPHDDRLDRARAHVDPGRHAHAAAPRRAKCAAPSAPV